MAKAMKRVSLITLLLTIVSYILFKATELSFLYDITITFGTIAYHFTIRLMIGVIVDLIMHNKRNYRNSNRIGEWNY